MTLRPDDVSARDAAGGRELGLVHDLSRAAWLATRSPTGPNLSLWGWVVGPEELRLYADRSRWVPAADPDRHDLVVACGTALALGRLALTTAGTATSVRYARSAVDSEPLATVRMVGATAPMAHDRAMAAAARSWSPKPGPLDGSALSTQDRQRLVEAASTDRITVQLIHHLDQLIWFTGLASRASASDEPDDHRRRSDLAVQLGISRSGEDSPLFAVVLAPSDGVEDRLRAGESAMRLILEAELRGLSARLVARVVGHIGHRGQLARALGGVGVPHVVLRIGARRPTGFEPVMRRRAAVPRWDRADLVPAPRRG